MTWLAALLVATLPSFAQPHALPGTAVLLDFGRDTIGVELLLPLDQFELGFGRPLMNDPLRVVARHDTELRAYVGAHLHAFAPDGRAWTTRIDSLEVVPAADASPVDLRVHLRLVPPSGAPSRRLRLDYDVINHEVRTHAALVFARSDWRNGVLAQQPELLGTIRWLTTGIDIDRGEGSAWRGLATAFRLGVHHIVDGTDHLLFLATLLLPAPLRREHRRWGGFAGLHSTLLRLATVVTAFTIGHSVTLLAGAIGGFSVSTRPVEVLVALSILVSAAHACRPLLARGDLLLAGGFGLVHGLAFSQAIAAGGLTGLQKLGAVLGFNLGIEFVQLLLVAIAAPVLIRLARTRLYTPLRLGGAGFAAVAAVVWMAERLQAPPMAWGLLTL